MDLTFFKGIITGLILSLPFGPVGIYCMEKTLVEGQKEGYISSLGMVTIDVVYGLTALLFLNQVEDIVKQYECYLETGIAIFLLVVGLKKMSNKMKLKKVEADPVGLIQNYFTTFFIALANISSIFTIMVIFTTLRLFDSDSEYIPFMVSSGIFIGGALEWFSTTYLLSHWRRTITEENLIKISRISGLIIFIFGIITLFHSLNQIIFR
ncbi:MAG: LysE family transporter [Fusobacterium sp.]|uniref:LysE family transporter n=1 Tax=Fusobacterium sp. TaxID=68766 RepID=UPI002600FE1B|nr:LysE family transporter [uncultured Fusobacterium sp.]